MSDQFTETTSESWFSRIGDSIKSFLFGLILIPAAIVLLSWSEGRSVTTAKSLKEGAGAVVAVDSTAVAPGNEGKLIHVSGDATTSDVVSDPTFGVSARALRLSRNVEMYQWKEKTSTTSHKKLGGGKETETTYSYEKAWSDDRIDSARFKVPEGHANPTAMVAQNFTAVAPHVQLGAFKVPAEVVGKMTGDEPLAPTDADLKALKPELQAKARLSERGFYIGADPSAPAIGDQQVTFKVLKPATFSVLAQQTGETLRPYSTKAGREIERVECGNVSAATMFQHAESENATLTWILRGVGFVAMSLGIGMILSPIVVFADVIPFVGSILGAGTFVAALLLGLVGSLITIAIAWLAVRPVLGVTLLVAAVAALVYARKLGARRKATVAPA
jgi:hypothetical protein